MSLFSTAPTDRSSSSLFPRTFPRKMKVHKTPTTTLSLSNSSPASSSSLSSSWPHSFRYLSSMAVVVLLRIALVLSLCLNVIIMVVYHHDRWNMMFVSTITITMVEETVTMLPARYGQNNNNNNNNNSTMPGTSTISTTTKNVSPLTVPSSVTTSTSTRTTTTTTASSLELVVEKRFEIGTMSTTSSKCKVIKNAEFILTNYTKHAIVESLSNLTMKFENHHQIMRFHIPEHHHHNIHNKNSTMSNTTGYATCIRKKIGWEEDFPHWFQQISRCWTFWQMHTHLQPIWRTDSDHPKYNAWIRRLIDLMPKMGILPVLYNQTNGHVHVIDGNFQPLGNSNTSSLLQQIDSITLVQQQQSPQSQDVSVTAYSIPTWPSKVGFQSTSTHHMMTFRKAVLDAIGYQETSRQQHPQLYGCQVPVTTTSTSSQAWKEEYYYPIPRIAMINRNKTRKLLNGWEILVDWKNHMNHSTYYNDIPKEYYLEGMTFDQQVTLLADIDILITPHGAQETNLVFMPPCAAILEVLPDQYFIPKYYGTLAASCGFDHAILYLADHLENKSVVGSTKQLSMCVPLESTRYGITRMVERWQQCCQRLGITATTTSP
jgi:hypothetical protein